METMTRLTFNSIPCCPCPLFQAFKDEHFSQILKISDVVRVAGEEVMVAEIDGKPASQYSLDEVRRALRMDGTHALALIESGGKKHKINLELPTM